MDRYIKDFKQFKDLKEVNEGIKEWALGALITLSAMAGISQTKQEFSKDKVQSALELRDKIEKDEDLSKLFSPRDLSFIDKNVDKLTSVSEKDIDKVDMKVETTRSLRTAISKARSEGYAISDIKITKDTIIPQKASVNLTDNITILYDSDAIFKTGSYTLTSESIEDITSIIESIKQDNNTTIKNIIVESSTDKEPIKMGNEKLASLRAESVVEVIDFDNVTVNILPEQGDDIFSKDMSLEEREKAREKTSAYRYVKVIIETETELEVEAPQTIPEIKNRYEIELIKLIEYGKGKVVKGKDSKRKVNSKPTCDKVVYDNNMFKCSI